MTNQELQKLTEHIAVDSFHRQFKHQVCFNGRLRTTGGRYHLKDHHIDINPLMLEKFDMDNLIGVIKHELVHYFLHMDGQQPSHRNPKFQQLLAQTNGLRYAPRIPKANSAKVIKYQCSKCGQLYLRKRHLDTKKFVCGKCRGKLQLI